MSTVYDDRVRMGRELHALVVSWSESISYDKALKRVAREHDEHADFEWAVSADGVRERDAYVRTMDEYHLWRDQYAELMREHLRGLPETEGQAPPSLETS